ncbi:MAG: hypothetical protein ACOC89_02050 [Candidatus Saliniplasma sp.]
MDKEEIEQILDDGLEDMPWTYKYWKREDAFEFRNTGRHLDKGQVDDLFDEFLDDLEESGFKVLLEGKAGVLLEDDVYWLCGVKRDGSPGDNDKKLDQEELKEIFVKSLHRIDGSPLPSNRVSVETSKIIDIYTEKVGEHVFLNITIKDNLPITLRNDGGLQVGV